MYSREGQFILQTQTHLDMTNMYRHVCYVSYSFFLRVIYATTLFPALLLSFIFTELFNFAFSINEGTRLVITVYFKLICRIRVTTPSACTSTRPYHRCTLAQVIQRGVQFSSQRELRFLRWETLLPFQLEPLIQWDYPWAVA